MTECSRQHPCLNSSRDVFSLPYQNLYLNDYWISQRVVVTPKTMNILNNLHLFPSYVNSTRYVQIIYRLLSNPNEEILHSVIEDSKKRVFKKSVVGIHIRSGGFVANYYERTYWITENELPSLSSFLFDLVRNESLPTVFYLTSDSKLVENYLKSSLRNFTFITNTRYTTGRGNYAIYSEKQLIHVSPYKAPNLGKPIEYLIHHHHINSNHVIIYLFKHKFTERPCLSFVVLFGLYY